MRQGIRALGWTVTISTIVLFAFLLTAGYSLFQTILEGHGIDVGDFQISTSNDTMVLSIPISVNNTGYYDLSEFQLATELKTINGTTLVANSVIIEAIKRGRTESASLNVSLSLQDLLSNMTYLLFNDTEFKIDFSMGFGYAHALGFQMEMMNTSMPWGAPLYGLNITEIGTPTFNGSQLRIDITLILENHSFFDVNGTLHLEALNEANEYIGYGRSLINLPSNTKLNEPIKVAIAIENPFNYTGKGTIKAEFEHMYSDYPVELEEISYG